MVKYAVLTIIGDKKKTKTESKWFFEKSSFLSYVRRNEGKILSYLLWDTDDGIRSSTLEELSNTAWKINHPKKEKPKKERESNMIMNKREVSYLHDWVNNETVVAIFTTNGALIKGIISGFDDSVLTIIRPDGRESLVYKHAISTIEKAH